MFFPAARLYIIIALFCKLPLPLSYLYCLVSYFATEMSTCLTGRISSN
ncbi:adenosine A3 receptor [Listeria ivanovii FSL F6-596]|nr:adenosine A3 receptor [Listeria ivanovii FSL F6-596]